ncbi:hypothetical protein M6B38_389100 [Iris pallida]|uniref:Uncharacterized protein n=1 Tax=Iris pallida TaxID=29817 RepID=A0AAX6G2I5_IRIPA|nr:hypothetical protein M6B38_389100 [Iris pallida]
MTNSKLLLYHYLFLWMRFSTSVTAFYSLCIYTRVHILRMYTAGMIAF